jgi:signal transduction histidine kinase
MRLPFRSILSRIIWLHVCALIGLAIVISSASYFLLDSTANDFEEGILGDHAKTVAEYLQLSDGQWKLALPLDLQATYLRGYGGFALAVADAAGNVIFSSLPDRRPLFPGHAQNRRPGFSKEHRGTSVYYALNFPVERDNQLAWVQVAQDFEDPDVIVDDVVSRFLEKISFITVPVFALLFMVDILIVRRALWPIHEASELATSIGPGKLDVRLPVADLPREIQPLAEAINDGLGRLSRAFQLQREFSADAAHELRTPLTLLRTQTDMMTDRVTAQKLQSDIDFMGKIVDQLLQLAELETYVNEPSEKTDLNMVCTDAVAAVAPIALAHEKAIGFTAASSPVWVSGNPELIYRAVKNLVDNAVRYTKRNTSVEVQVTAPGMVAVADHGPGVHPSERALIFQRFWRRDRRNTDHSGLGLSIVAETARLLRASVQVDDRPGGGAVFRLIFNART